MESTVPRESIRVILVSIDAFRTPPEHFFVRMNASPKLRIAVTILLLAAWSGTTACDKLGLGDDSPTSPSPPSKDTPIIYGAVGASDVIGVGSSAPCYVLFGDCPESKGYVFVAAGALRSQGYTVTVVQRGLPTATISRRFMELGQQYGHFVAANFIDSQLPFVPREATAVTIFAGGNDVNIIVAALGGGAGGADPTGYIDQQVRNFASDYTTLLNGIRERTPSARIIVLNVPNLALLPYVSNRPLAHRQALHRAAFGMTTTVVNTLVSQGVRVVDLMCMAQLYQPASLSSDGFHPSDAGYALLAGEVVRAVTSTSYPAPMGTCPQMAQP